jgi:hypothetical protein
MASEGARMMEHTQNPPRLAEALLRSLLRPSDRESIPGDLIEEYRAVTRPALGAVRANIWYVKHVVSVLWRLTWPYALAMSGLMVLFLTLKDAREYDSWPYYVKTVINNGTVWACFAIYLCAGLLGSRRTRLVRTGAILAGAASILGLTAGFAFEVIHEGGTELLLAPLRMPFMFVILAMIWSPSIAFGIIGGIVGSKWLPPLLTTFGC